MAESFNLIEEPWVPCVDNNGACKDYSLGEIFAQAPNLSDLAGDTPLVTASLYRLLLAILHRIYGPEKISDWKKLWQARSFPQEPLSEYFEEWHDRFDLFGKKPFLQTELKGEIERPVHRLLFVAENNSTLFAHSNDLNASVYETRIVIRLVLSFCNYDMAGRPDFKDTSCRNGAQFFVKGDNLFESLLLNLFRYDEEHPKGLKKDDKDRPVWEQDRPYNNRKQPYGYLDYLTWPARKIQLVKKDNDCRYIKKIKYSQGLPIDQGSFFDPFKAYRPIKDGDELVSIGFNENKALWRDSQILLYQYESSRPPSFTRWLGMLKEEGVVQNNKKCSYCAYGLANDKKKVNFIRQETYPLPIEILEDKSAKIYIEKALTWAEGLSGVLFSAAREFAKVYMLNKRGDYKSLTRFEQQEVSSFLKHCNPEKHYWPKLESRFRQFIVGLSNGKENALKKWREYVRISAKDAFSSEFESISHGGKGIKAYALADKMFNGSLHALQKKMA